MLKRKISQHPILFAELILLLIALLLMIWIALSETNKYSTLQGGLVLLNAAALVICPLVMLWFLERDSKAIRELKKKDKFEKSKKYRKQFVSSFCVENPYFGPCTFERDINKNCVTLIDGMKGTRFGIYNVEKLKIVVNEKNIPTVLKKLEEVYKNAEEILRKTYLGALEQLNAWGETDEMGNPVSLDCVKKYYDLISIEVHDETIELIGSVSDEYEEILLGENLFITEIDCSTGEVTCLL